MSEKITEKTQAVHLEDGRKADKIVQEEYDEGTNGTKIITEVWAEPKIDKKLTQRVVEYKKPVVYRREIETVDETTGMPVEKKIESIENDVRMELREHAQYASVLSDKNSENENLELISQSLQSIAEVLSDKSDKKGKVSAMQTVVADKIETEDKDNLLMKVLWVAIAAGTAVWTYLIFM